GLTAADFQQELLENPASLQGMGHFRVELDTIDRLLFPSHGGNGAAGCGSNAYELGRHFCHFITVAHPHIQQGAAVVSYMVSDIVQQAAWCLQLNLGITELTHIRTGHLAAQLLGHGLHTVANTEHRHSQLEDALRSPRGVQLDHGLGATGQDDALWIEVPDFLFGHIKCTDFAIHSDFPNPTGNQLSVLGAEIQNKNSMSVNVLGHDSCYRLL